MWPRHLTLLCSRGLPAADRGHSTRWQALRLREPPGDSEGTERHSTVWCFIFDSFTDWSSRMTLFVLPPGQEADKGSVRRAGPPPELLQVHGAGVQRDVPSLLHQAAALQSHQVPTAVQIGRASSPVRDPHHSASFQIQQPKCNPPPYLLLPAWVNTSVCPFSD